MQQRAVAMAVFVAFSVFRVSAVEEIKVATLDDFRTAMTAIGESFDVIEEMVAGPAFLLNSARGDGLRQVRVIQRNLRGVRGFFINRSKTDGAKLVDGAAGALADLELELTRATPDQGSAIDAVADVKSACAACHASYREGTKETGFRFKRGAL